MSYSIATSEAAPRVWQSLSASDPSDAPQALYWPPTLDLFLWRMAACGHCVSAAMMLGDRHYARQQLMAALAMKDEALRETARELSDYFAC